MSKNPIRRVGLYLRVSTAEQTTENQSRELLAVAERHGWAVVRVFEDAGISGAKNRTGRPGLDAMMKAIARREIDMVAAWSVDRLGRSLTDLLDLLRELHSKDVDLFLHQQGLDTSTPAGRAMFQMGCLPSSSGRCCGSASYPAWRVLGRRASGWADLASPRKKPRLFGSQKRAAKVCGGSLVSWAWGSGPFCELTQPGAP